MNSLFMTLVLSAMASPDIKVQTLDYQSKFTNKQDIAGLTKQITDSHEEEWKDCVTQANKNITTYKTLAGWIYLEKFKCALYSQDPDLIKDSIKNLSAIRPYLAYGPWRLQLVARFIDLNFLAFEVGNQTALADTAIDNLGEIKDLLDKDQRSKYDARLAELIKGKNPNAGQSFLQLSKNEKNKNDKATTLVDSDNPEQLKLAEQFNKALKVSRGVEAIEAGVNYLNKFPLGVLAKVIGDKTVDIYFERDPKNNYINTLLKVEPNKMAEWARILHKKGDYVGSYKLAEKAIGVSNVAQNPILLYIAGRSTQFMGEYSKAKGFLSQYLARYPDSDDAMEVMFRLAVVLIRMGDYKEAIANFDHILRLKNNDRYELSAHYWKILCIDKIKDEKRNAEKDAEKEIILKKFSISYYGLKLLAQKNNNQIDWPFEYPDKQKMTSEIYLSPAQKNAWQRISLLAQAGWVDAVSREITDLDMSLGGDGQKRTLLAKLWSSAQAYPSAIKLINESFDIDNNFKDLEFVKLGYPIAFKDEIEKYAKKQNLDPSFVRSLIRQESAFNVYATSSSNALGLMQLIPPTAQEVAQALGWKSLDLPEDLFKADTNIEMGSYYIAQMVQKFNGVVPLALAAYNAGPYKMQSFTALRPELFTTEKLFSEDPFAELWVEELPWAETNFYVKAILRNTIVYKILGKESDKGRVSVPPVVWSDLVLKN